MGSAARMTFSKMPLPATEAFRQKLSLQPLGGLRDKGRALSGMGSATNMTNISLYGNTPDVGGIQPPYLQHPYRTMPLKGGSFAQGETEAQVSYVFETRPLCHLALVESLRF